MKPRRQRTPQTPFGRESSQSRTQSHGPGCRQSQRDNWNQLCDVWRLDLPGRARSDRVTGVSGNKSRMKTRWKNRKLRVIVDRRTKTVPLKRDGVDLTRSGDHERAALWVSSGLAAEDREVTAAQCPAKERTRRGNALSYIPTCGSEGDVTFAKIL